MPSSSSNRTPGHCDAVLTCDAVLKIDSSDTTTSSTSATSSTAVGPLRLPLKEPASFVAQFNRIYARIGLSVREVNMNCVITSETLRQKKCVPCEGGVPVIEAEAAKAYLQSLPDWSIDDDGKLIFRKINAGNFVRAMGIMQKIAELAESEQHHPDLHLTGYRNLRIDLTTHAINGLSENDFVVAAKIDILIA